jgi:hypothetical protein
MVGGGFFAFLGFWFSKPFRFRVYGLGPPEPRRFGFSGPGILRVAKIAARGVRKVTTGIIGKCCAIKVASSVGVCIQNRMLKMARKVATFLAKGRCLGK